MTTYNDYNEQRWKSNEDMVTELFETMIERRMYKQVREHLEYCRDTYSKYEHYNKLLNAVEDIQKEFPHHKVNKIVLNIKGAIQDE